jgi:hypothetical protein
MVMPDIPYGLSGHRISVGLCNAGPYAGWYVACFRYVGKNGQWFMLEFGDGTGGTDPNGEVTFDDEAELNGYLGGLDVTWFADREALAVLKKAFRAHRIYPKFVERILTWITTPWKHMG